ncbi:MAG: hypothetical protein WAZ34_16035 [Rhodocyclaceae bacterium]
MPSGISGKVALRLPGVGMNSAGGLQSSNAMACSSWVRWMSMSMVFGRIIRMWHCCVADPCVCGTFQFGNIYMICGIWGNGFIWAGFLR